MQDKFWRIIACLMCVGLFYVGHGLHGPRDAGLPSLENVAHADGVAWHPESPDMFTASQDGRHVYSWKRFKDVREGKIVVQYIGRTDATSEPRPRLDAGQFRGGAPVPDPSPRQAPEQPPKK